MASAFFGGRGIPNIIKGKENQGSCLSFDGYGVTEGRGY